MTDATLPPALEPLRDPDRLRAALEAVSVLEPPDPWADGLCARMALEFDCPIAFLNVITHDGYWVRGSQGLGQVAPRTGAAKDSICAYVAASGRDLQVTKPTMRPLLSECTGADAVGYYLGLAIHLHAMPIGAVGVASVDERDELPDDEIRRRGDPFRDEVEHELARRARLT